MARPARGAVLGGVRGRVARDDRGGRGVAAARSRSVARAGSRRGGSRAADGPRGRRDRVRGRGAGRAARRAARRRDGRGRARRPVGHRRVAAPRRAAGHGAVAAPARPVAGRRCVAGRRVIVGRRRRAVLAAPPRGRRGRARRRRGRARVLAQRLPGAAGAGRQVQRQRGVVRADARPGRVRGHAQLDVGGRGARVVVPGAERGHRAATRRRGAGAADRHALRVPDGAGRGDRPGPRLQEPGEGHVRARGGVRRHGAPAAHADRAIKAAARREIFLCHAFCEVGATKAVDALKDVHEFLVAAPGGGADPVDRGRHGPGRHGEADPRQRPDPRGLPRARPSRRGRRCSR